ncbi:hypothetical protein [Desulfovibrio subterraneus]|jgi:hypothetical protein|uniref:Lipoprotein n=1 Tax=Desulfovibrio subterraneus TaxID=2718620 RepID=A0A7J0BJD6_9BACT|nr:hypothetical protein [Desulfovibrio subterraneus]GFM33739.1 hypothetical protein DSM101010T_21040 [Desulfovibrio subterraneus]
MNKKIYNPKMLCAAAALALCFIGSAEARVASGEWMDKLPAGKTFEIAPLRSKDEAKRFAFADAVFAEATEILRNAGSDERKVLLQDYLKERASHFIMSYTELGVENLPEGSRLTVDVHVNRDLLRQELKRLGFFATGATPLAYSPQYGAVQPDTWETLGRLHVLYGLTPSSAAPLELKLDYAGKVWTVSLVDRSAPSAEPYFATADSLDGAWGKVWGKYFGGMNEDKAVTASVTLTVDGWFTPDGVEAFDTMLQEWSDVLDTVSLQDVSMEASGISGHWAVNILDADKLRERLQDYTSKRRLSFALKDR